MSDVSLTFQQIHEISEVCIQELLKLLEDD